VGRIDEWRERREKRTTRSLERPWQAILKSALLWFVSALTILWLLEVRSFEWQRLLSLAASFGLGALGFVYVTVRAQQRERRPFAEENSRRRR
jgi:hypothetical protein